MPRGFLFYFLLSLFTFFSNVYGQQVTNHLFDSLKTEDFPASELERELKGIVSKSQLSESCVTLVEYSLLMYLSDLFHESEVYTG